MPVRKRPARRFLACCLWLFLAACGSQDSLLNSERIARTFGSVGIDVIQSDDQGRVSSLYSGAGDDKTTRTFAVVEYSGSVRRAFEDEHARIVSGEPIGAVFKSAGWQVEKYNIFVGEMEIPAKYALLSELMRIELPRYLATHVYEFVVRKDDRSYDYAMIVELHHPGYLTAADLKIIYGEIIFDDSARSTIDDYVDPSIWRN